MTETTANSSSPRAQLGLLLRGLDHRGRLAALEVGAAGDHLIGTLMIAAGAYALIVLTGFTLIFTLAASVWHLAERGWILGGAAALMLAIAALLARHAYKRWRDWQPLSTTRHHLGEDCRLISELVPGHDQ